MLKYDYQLKHVPGKKLIIADMLCRIQGQKLPEDSSEDVEIHAISILSDLVSPKTMAELAEAIAKDPELQIVIKRLEALRPIEGELKRCANEESVVRGILLKGTKVVIPPSMLKQMLERLHHGHLGTGKSKARVRQLTYWPRMNDNITAMVERCPSCQLHPYRQADEPLLLQDTPDHPWERVGADLFEYAGRRYIVVYGSNSNFPDFEELQGITARAVVKKLSRIFARYGIPKQLCTDGGPQFTAKEFKDFSQIFDFEHVISSPLFPRSNGLAEKGVEVVKRLMKKAGAAGDFLID